MSILTEINRIKDAVTAIVNAIKGKGVTVPTTAKVDDLASLVSAIPTGTDTSDATATASDILLGETAYVNGEKVTGNIPIYDGAPINAIAEGETDDGFIFFAYTYEDFALISKDGFINSIATEIPKSEFGDARSEYVCEGLTFTSENGVCIAGTMPIYDYTPMPAWYSESTDTDFVFGGGLENPISTVLEDELYIKVPKTEFGDALAYYVADTFTFTSENGVNVRGSAPIYDYTPIEAYPADETDTDHVFMGSVGSNTVFEDEIYLKVSKSNFGNAKASDVRKGKTFTSADGVCITGTYEAASIKTCTVNVTFSYNPQNVTLYFPVLDEGEITHTRSTTNTGSTLNLQNVVCGSVIYVSARNSFYIYNWAGGFSMNNNTAAVFVPSSEGNYTLDIGMLDD